MDGMVTPRPGAVPRRVCLLGATGTIGRATLRALVRRGHSVVGFVRARPGGGVALAGAETRTVDMADPASIVRDGFRGERFDAVVSCMASRTGAPRDAWAVDHQAHANMPSRRRVRSRAWATSCCFQRSACRSRVLAFQHAKLRVRGVVDRRPA